jgi:hypothetical protein
MKRVASSLIVIIPNARRLKKLSNTIFPGVHHERIGDNCRGRWFSVGLWGVKLHSPGLAWHVVSRMTLYMLLLGCGCLRLPNSGGLGIAAAVGEGAWQMAAVPTKVQGPDLPQGLDQLGAAEVLDRRR